MGAAFETEEAERGRTDGCGRSSRHRPAFQSPVPFADISRGGGPPPPSHVVVATPKSLIRVFERDGARVILDDYTAEKMGGATVDFTQELIKQAFVVVGNPNAQSGCGCGVSFDLKQT